MARTIRVEVIADVSQLSRKFSQATQQTKGFVNSMETIGPATARSTRGFIAGSVAIAGMGRAIAFASAQFLGGYGLAFALAHSTKAAIDFQQQMLLIKTQAGGLHEDIAGLSKEVLALAPAVATSPETLAKGLYHIESAGIRGHKAIQELRIAAMGAKIGMDDLEATTNALVAAQQSGLKGTKDLAAAMGVLDAITGAGNLRLSDLTKALHSGVTGTAKEVGISLTGLGAALATLTIQGVPAQQAATRLRTSLALLAAPTRQAQRELKGIGIGPLELAKALRRGDLPAALDLLSSKLLASGKSAEGMTATIVRAFGAARSSATIIQLLQHLDLVHRAFQQIEDQGSKATFRQKWQLQMQTAKFATDKLMSSVQTLEIFIGQALSPTVVKVANSISHWLSSTKNQKRVQEDIKKIIKETIDFLKFFWKIVTNVTDAVGGLKHGLELLIGLKVADVFFGWGESIKELIDRFKHLANAEKIAAQAAQTTATLQTANALGGAGMAAGALGGAAQQTKGMSRFADTVTEAELLAAGVPIINREPEFARGVNRDRAGHFISPGAFAGANINRTDLTSENIGRIPLGEGQVGFRPGMTAFEGGAEVGILAQGIAPTVAKVGKLGAAAKMAESALGKGGLVATAGLVSYELASLGLEATGLRGRLSSFGGWLHKITESKPPKIPTQPQATSAFTFARGQLEKLDSLKAFAPQQDVHKFIDGLGREIVTKTLKDSVQKQRLVATIRAKFNVDEKAAEIWANAAINAARRWIEAKKGIINLPVVITPGPAGTDASRSGKDAGFANVKPRQNVGTLEKLQEAEALARLQIAKGDQSANQRLVALLRQQIAFDEKYAKIQEDLIRRGVGDANKHAKTVAALRADEAAAYSEITDATKKLFEVPMGLQINQAKAALTSGTGDDVKAANAIKAWVEGQIKSGKLKGQDLLSALQELASLKTQQSFQIPLALQLKQADASVTQSTADDRSVWRQIKKFAEHVRHDKKSTTADKIAADQAIAEANQALQTSPVVPMALLVKQAFAATTAIQTDDVKVAKQIRHWAVAMVKSGKFKGQALIDLLNLITTENQVIGGSGVATAYHMTSTHKLTEGMNLPRGERIALEQRIAQSEAHDGRAPNKGAYGAQGFPVGNVVTVNIHGGDEQVVYRAVMKAIGKHDRRSAPQTRGRYGKAAG